MFDTGLGDAPVASSNGTPLPGLSLRQHAGSAGDQYLQSITGLADGGYLVAWRGSSSSGEDGIGLYVQRYGSDGLPAGGEMLLVAEGSRTDVGLNWNWDITGLSNGGFALTWTHWTYENNYGAWQPVASDVVSRVYDAAGQPVADVGPLPKPIDGNGQELPSNSDDSEVVGLEGGGFVRVWENTTEDMIYSQMYDAAGNKVGGSLRAYDLHLGPQPSVYDGQVAALLGGGFVVTWEMNNHSTTENGRDVYAQVYSSAGAGSGAFLVNTGHALASQDNQVVTALGSGGFVIVWDDAGHGVDWDPTYGYKYYEHRGIYAQIYDAAGRPVGGEFAVEAGATSAWNSPVVVSSTADGGFIAVWGEGDSLSPSRVGQRFDDAGNRIGDKFTLAEGIGTSSSDGSMQLITLADGSLLAAWYQYSPGGDVLGQRLTIGSRDADEVIEGRSGIADDVIYGHGGDDVIRGLAGDDVLDGGTGNDTLDGGVGADLFIGGAGADSFLGGAGVDTADYSMSIAAVTVDLEGGIGRGGYSHRDVFVSIENVTGSAFADVLAGSADANVQNGGDGNDILKGSAGGDRMIGGSGGDTADYATSIAGVTVNLSTGLGSGGYAHRDTLTSIENVTGSVHADVLTGNDLSNTLDGGAGGDLMDGGGGDDTLMGSVGGDRLIGGAGVDLADYTHSIAGISVHLRTGAAYGGYAHRDTISGVENVTGSRFADTLIGDDGANRLDGNGGHDVLNGGAGDDVLVGGLGNDRFVFGNIVGSDTILDFIAGAGSYDRIDLTANSSVDSFADVMAHATQSSGNTVISLGVGHQITLTGVSLAALHQDDFVF